MQSMHKAHEEQGNETLKRTPYLSKLESIASSAVRAADKVGRNTEGLCRMMGG